MDGGDIRRAREYQMMDLADGKYESPVDLLKAWRAEMRAITGRSVSFQRALLQTKEISLMSLLNPLMMRVDKSDAIYNFNLSTRDSHADTSNS